MRKLQNCHLFVYLFNDLHLAEIQEFGPVFNQTFLEAVFQLQESIDQLGENDVKIEKICFAPMSTGTEVPTVSQCVVQSLYGYFKNSMEKFRETSNDSNGFINNYLNKLDKCLV